jgi:hypothetical protein
MIRGREVRVGHLRVERERGAADTAVAQPEQVLVDAARGERHLPAGCSFDTPSACTRSRANASRYPGGTREEARKVGAAFPAAGELSRKLITAAKRTVERSWLGEVCAVVLQQSLGDAESAYRNFFASLKGERNGAKSGAPRFKSRKGSRQSIRLKANARWSITGSGKLNLPKIGAVQVKWSSRHGRVLRTRDDARRRAAGRRAADSGGTGPVGQPCGGDRRGVPSPYGTRRGDKGVEDEAGNCRCPVGELTVNAPILLCT